MSTDHRTSSAARADSGRAAPTRRIGYAVAIVVNLVLFLLVNVWPTWRILPFLTEATQELIGLVNLSLIAGVVVNILNLVFDLAWVRAVGEIVTSVIALIVVVRFWIVFPFDFGDSGFDWELVTRVLLAVAVAGTVISIIVQVVILVRLALGARASGTYHPPPG